MVLLEGERGELTREELSLIPVDLLGDLDVSLIQTDPDTLNIWQVVQDIAGPAAEVEYAITRLTMDEFVEQRLSPGGNFRTEEERRRRSFSEVPGLLPFDVANRYNSFLLTAGTELAERR